MAAELSPTYRALRAMLEEESAGMRRSNDPRAGFCVIAGYSPHWKKDLFFGGVRLGKSYVSYYLFPVYMVPGLMNSASPELRRRMQGKSCFNFRSIAPELLSELRELTRRCRAACEDGTIEVANVTCDPPARKKATVKKATVKKAAARKAPARRAPARRAATRK